MSTLRIERISSNSSHNTVHHLHGTINREDLQYSSQNTKYGIQSAKYDSPLPAGERALDPAFLTSFCLLLRVLYQGRKRFKKFFSNRRDPVCKGGEGGGKGRVGESVCYSI